MCEPESGSRCDARDKAKIGELLPAGKVGAGRGGKSKQSDCVDFDHSTIAAYRKIAANKAKIGELLPAKPPKETGRGKKTTIAGVAVFNPTVISAYRKIAANKSKIDEYAESVEDVPTQGEFIRFCSAGTISRSLVATGGWRGPSCGTGGDICDAAGITGINGWMTGSVLRRAVD